MYAHTCMDNPDILSTHTHTRTQKITTGLSQLLHNTDQQNLPLCEEKALIIQRESSALQARCGGLCFRGSSNLHLPTFFHLVTFPNKDPPCVSACSEVILLCDTPPPPSVIFSRHQFNSGRSATSSLYCANPHSLGSYWGMRHYLGYFHVLYIPQLPHSRSLALKRNK